MSDPRNAAHAKKVTQGKKHQATAVPAKEEAPAAAPDASAAAPTPAGLDASLVVLSQLKDLEFHSRANLERLAALTMTVDDELKQKEMVAPLGEVYLAQSAFQTKLTALLELYKAECERLQGPRTT